MPTRDIRKVLVANRGEIARRIFRTAREMGIATVAVYSDADRDAAFVGEADEAVRLGPAPAAESYLDHEAVIAAARVTGAEAIHPGYGFLSENADFAERCAKEGLIFIGPPAAAVRSMGNKAEAKALAAKVGVPVLDGFDLEGLDEDEIRQRVEELGLPVLIKAVAGGGGKGMRVVRSVDDLADAVAAAAREAEGAFGDGTLLVERFVDSPRHVEIQVFADSHGRVVHLFERDCSLQRRHQKVFEEAPSPAVDAALRERMGQAAVALAEAVGYEGAGTGEFLLDASGEFFFLEMNTRLQVEHPVTEMVTGLDLVRLQIDVARGLPLPETDLELTGHAIEARLYAEDAANDFLPASGPVSLWSTPELPGLRIDSGVEQGDTVGIHYDPMLAKVIAHGATRDEALRRLRRGLSELAVGGLTTNRDFLLDVLDHEAFVGGEADTGFLDRHFAQWRPTSSALALHALAATLWLVEERRGAGPTPAGIVPGWRNNAWRPQEQIFEHGESQVGVRYTARDGQAFAMEVALGDGDAAQHEVRIVEASHNGLSLEIDGLRRRFLIAGSERKLSIHGAGQVSDLRVLSRFPERGAAAIAGGCAAPMTGRVIEVRVAEGDRVEAGTTLVILEAMKMEHALEAPADGVVDAVRVEAGQMVDPDEVLVVVTPEEEA